MKAIPMAERVENFRRFYDRRNRRPLFGFFIGSEYPLPRYPFALGLPEDRPLGPADFPTPAFLDDAERLFERHEACGGDFIFSDAAYWGIPWLEAALGCPILASRASGSLFAVPPAGFRGPESLPVFDPGGEWANKAGEMLEGLAGRAAGRFPLATTRMRGVADLLAALYGGEGMVMAMLERPAEIKAAAASLTDFYIDFARFQLERIPAFHGGLGSFYYNMWAPAGTVWHQEDSVMLLSPDLYAEFIGPCDRAVFAAFRGNIMHFHSKGGYAPIDEVLALQPTAIELHIDAGGPSAEELFERHSRILSRSPLLVWGDLSPADLDWLFGRLPQAGLAVIKAVRSPEEARALWERHGGAA